MTKLLKTAFLAILLASAVYAQTNVGEQKPDPDLPFTITQVASFDLPWRIAFLPDGRMLVTEKVGRVVLVTPQGAKSELLGVPPSYYQGQNGMLGVFLSPHYATDHNIYLTYAEPGDYGGGLAMGRGQLVLDGPRPKLDGFQVLWRQLPKGKGGQEGAQIAFSPDGNYIFLTVGDRQRFTPAQDPNQPEGKILRLTLDGKPAPGNPMEGKTGASSIPLIDPPTDTEAAKTAPVVSTYTFSGPNLTPAETWTSGHRTPYGLAFGPDGRLWEVEHGPRGGDELNLIEKGRNYGWPVVSYGLNYNGVPIASHDTQPDFAKPVLYWVPVIAPGNIMFYKGSLFPKWDGNAFVSGLVTMALVRITFDGKGGATAAQRWNIGKRIRDIEEAPDGSLWMLEDSTTGGLYHLTPTTAASANAVTTDPGSEPESITASPDGGLILGSATKPTIYRAAKGETKAKPWIDVRDDGNVTFLGVLSDVSTNTLWACEIGPRSAPGVPSPSTLLSFDLTSGAPKSRWKLPGDTSLCNDFTVGPDHALYVSDTFTSTIYRMRPGATVGEVFVTGRALDGIDGLTFLDGVLYANNVVAGTIWRIPMDAMGKAGNPVNVWTDQQLKGPDGMRAAGGHLFVAENANGRASMLTIKDDTAHVTVIQTGLKRPTAIEPAGDVLWVGDRLSDNAIPIPLPR